MSPYHSVMQLITPTAMTAPVSDKLLEMANEVREVARQGKGVRQNLESSWVGMAEINYMVEFGTTPEDLESFATLLEMKAFEIRLISFWYEVVEWFDDLVDGVQ